MDMKRNINWIIEYFSSNSIEFVDIFKTSLLPNEKDINRKTAKDVFGIVIPIKGECNFSLNEDKHHLNNNTILHCGSNLKIKVETKDVGMEYYVVHYKNISIEDRFKSIEKESFSLEIEDRLELVKYCESIIDKSLNPDNYSNFLCKVEFLNLVSSLIKNVMMTQYSDKLKLVNKAVEYINKNYNELITVTEIADILEIDRRRFSDIFKDVIGLSPVKYLNEYRLKEARRLLKFSSHTISEIAEMTGYNDCFYFSKNFKKNLGICPKKYRERNNNFFTDIVLKK